MSRLFLLCAALSGATGVGLGALAAHALRARLEPALLEAFHTGVSYQLWHSLALLAVGLWCRQYAMPLRWYDALPLAGLAFMAGIVCFSGSLYLLALGGPRWLGPVTPVGGVAFITGWLLLAAAAWRQDA